MLIRRAGASSSDAPPAHRHARLATMRTHDDDVVAGLAGAGVEVSVHLMSDTALFRVAAFIDLRLGELAPSAGRT
jgi:hypothetical protein